MNYTALTCFAFALVSACATDQSYDPLEDYVEVKAATIMRAPGVDVGRVAPENRDAVRRGKYLVELLGCGSCHTDGALIGEPNEQRSLAGSSVGIAFTNPLQSARPGIVFPPNITPDDATGIGQWSNQEIAAAIRVGEGRHGPRRILVMPWQAYAGLSEADIQSIIGYLRSIEPVRHTVPADVPAGRPTSEMFVHFGVYRSR